MIWNCCGKCYHQRTGISCKIRDCSIPEQLFLDVDGNEFADWLLELLVDNIECDCMKQLRRGWFIDNVDDLLALFAERNRATR